MQALDDSPFQEKQFGSSYYEAQPAQEFAGNPLLSLREWMSAENVALFAVCMADMISTLYWVHAGLATEDNPVFREWLRRGDGPFIFMKFLSFMPLIAVSTYYRRRRPKLIRNAMWLTVGAYVFLYIARLAPQFIGR